MKLALTHSICVKLKINQNNTKLLRYRKVCEHRIIKIGEYEFEEVDKFKYNLQLRLQAMEKEERRLMTG